MMPSWKRSSAELVAAFDAALPADPRVERRSMFGYPCAFSGGNMFAGLHEEKLVVRLSEVDRDALRALRGAAVFEPMKGRAMKEYTVVPSAMHGDHAELAKWIARALEFASTLPKKAAKTKPAPKRKAAAKKRASKQTV